MVTKVLEGVADTMVGVLEAAADARDEVATAGAMKAELGSAAKRQTAARAASDSVRPPEKSILVVHVFFEELREVYSNDAISLCVCFR